jgi:flagellin
VYQVGSNVGDTIAVSLQQGVAANQIGQYSSKTGTAVTAVALTGGSTVTASDGTTTVTVGPTASYVGASATYQGATSAYAKAAAINGAGLQGLTASAATSAGDTAAFSTITAGATTDASYALSINGQAIFSNFDVTVASGGLTNSAVAQQINLFSGTTGVTASVAAVATTINGVTTPVNGIILSNTDGSDINVSQTVTAGTGAGAGGAGLSAAIASTGAGTTTKGNVTLTDSKPVTFTDVGATGGSAALGLVSGVATGLSTVAGGATATLANQNVLTVAGANSTISSVDAALSSVSAFQSQLGAIQNRFASAVSNLTSTAQNLTQSRSTIQDANFAAETANLTQAQVLEQAGISVLAQANQQPQLILKLLA